MSDECSAPATVNLFGVPMFCEVCWGIKVAEAEAAPRSVCPECQGTGTDFGQAIEFTGADMDEWYGDDYYEREQFVSDYRNGAYSIPCQTCSGNKVVLTSELPRLEAQLAQRLEWEAEIAAESAYNRYC